MITRKRDLRSGKSYWMSRPLQAIAVNRFTSRAKFDVVVVGAGISGSIIADCIAERGLSVAIVDRREPVSGSTPASTALLQYEIDTPLILLAGKIGKTRAQRIWRRSKLCVDALRERTRRLGIAADLHDRNSLYLDGNVLSRARLAEEHAARLEMGFESTFLEPRELRRRFGVAGRCAILSYANMEADPRRLAAGFLQSARQQGAKLFSPVEIADVDASDHGVVLRSKDGRELRANHAIFATGYEWLQGIPKKGHSVGSTWAIATKPQRKALWPERVFIWEASEPYLYMRTTPDDRVICGGADEDFADADCRDAMMDEKVAVIRRGLAALFPAIDTTPDFQWCGNFGQSSTGSPTIGPTPNMPRCYAAMGFGGNGITFSMMAAQVLANTIAGNGDPDADLVSFNRSA